MIPTTEAMGTQRGFTLALVAVKSPQDAVGAAQAAILVGSQGRLCLLHVTAEPHAEQIFDAKTWAAICERQLERQDRARRMLQDLSTALGLASAETQVLTGSVSGSIVVEAERLGPDLVVVGGHRAEGAQPEAGSTAKAVLRATPLSVLVARPRPAADETNPFATVAVATDFTACDSHAAAWAAEFARRSGARLRIVHVVDTAALWEDDEGPKVRKGGDRAWRLVQSSHRRRLAQFEKDCPAQFCETQQLVGDPADQLLAYVEREGVDLLIVGTNAEARARHGFLGSVAGELAEKAPCSVLVWRQPDVLVSPPRFEGKVRPSQRRKVKK